MNLVQEFLGSPASAVLAYTRPSLLSTSTDAVPATAKNHSTAATAARGDLFPLELISSGSESGSGSGSGSGSSSISPKTIINDGNNSRRSQRLYYVLTHLIHVVRVPALQVHKLVTSTTKEEEVILKVMLPPSQPPSQPQLSPPIQQPTIPQLEQKEERWEWMIPRWVDDPWTPASLYALTEACGARWGQNRFVFAIVHPDTTVVYYQFAVGLPQPKGEPNVSSPILPNDAECPGK